MTRPLEGKTCIVTGGNSGIGEATVLALAAQGANVVLDYITHPEDADTVVAKAEKAGGQAVAVKADVSKVNDLHALISTAVETYGRLDVMVNNAGVETRTGLLDTDVADLEKVIDIDLKSAVFGTKFAAEQFIKQGGGGLVVNMSSVHEDWPMPGNIAYCIAKGGVRMLTRTAGVELGHHGVRIVNVAPGAVATPINASEMSNADDMATLRKTIPLGQMATPEQIADVVVFLATTGTYLTATTVTVDGGLTQGAAGL